MYTTEGPIWSRIDINLDQLQMSPYTLQTMCKKPTSAKSTHLPERALQSKR